jgi:hypothetical protein
LNVKIIDSKLTYDIRKKVLWPHIKDDNYSLKVDKDVSTFHLGTYINKKIISIGTFVKENNSKFNSNSQYKELYNPRLLFRSKHLIWGPKQTFSL